MATLTVTATEEPTTTPPRVRLDITASGTPTVTSVSVTRTDQGGQVSPVRTADGGSLPVSGGSATIYDYEVPYQTSVTYEIAATGASSVTASAYLDVADIWLVHPGVPALSMPLPVVSEIGNEHVRALDRGTFQVIGRKDPIFVTGGARSTPVGVLGIRTKTDSEREALDAILDDGTPLLLNLPTSLYWGMATCYIAVGDVSMARTVEYAAQPWREWSLPYQVVRRPAGGSQALITWQTVYDDNGSPTWTALYAAAGSPTWAELANPIT